MTEDNSVDDFTSILRPLNAPVSATAAGEELTKLLGSNKFTNQQMLALLESPRTRIFNDVPAEADAFGFSSIVRILSDIVLSSATETPLTLCIDGQWGTGKTSMMRQIEQQARLVGLPCVWLNAWSFENADTLIQSLTAEIKLEGDRWKPTQAIAKTIVENLGKFVLRNTGVTGQLIADLKNSQDVAANQALEVASVVTTNRSFENLVSALLEAVKAAPSPNDQKIKGPTVTPRLIVFIDDIDRALPDQIVATLKTLRLVLDDKRCVFILGMDFDLVSRSIVNYYRGETSKLITPEEITIQQDTRGVSSVSQSMSPAHTNFGKSYLEKLIQLQVKVPGLDRNNLEKYLRRLDIAPEVIEIIQWSPDAEVLNPRRLKRFINWLSITLELIKDSPLPDEVSNLTALRSLALRRDHPEVYRRALDARRDWSIISIDPAWLKDIAHKRYLSDEEMPQAMTRLQTYLQDIVEHLFVFDASIAQNSLLKSAVDFSQHVSERNSMDTTVAAGKLDTRAVDVASADAVVTGKATSQ